jgi:hypothetical protein
VRRIFGKIKPFPAYSTKQVLPLSPDEKAKFELPIRYPENYCNPEKEHPNG